MNAAEIVYTRLLLEERSDDAPFGLRLLARIEQAWRVRQAEREQERATRRATDFQQLHDN
jgi:hypothetical protein